MKYLLLLCALLIAATATADVYMYEFSGHVDYFSSKFTHLVPNVQVGQTFTGWFSYSDKPYNSNYGSSEQNASFSFTLGNFTFSHIDDYALLNMIDGSFDFFSLNTYGTHEDFEYLRTGVTFRDLTASAFDTNAALPTYLDLSMFSPDECLLNFNGSDAGGSMTGILDTLVMVPEPSSLVILLCGGLLLRRK